ncbi:cation:H+ antiporter [Allocatelliglobosispora scoriae]|uniref:Cation:H+ antiporter n=1 Tax=Allocatelliglobosispora scoriae TaxID=643052 RepID=A0A841BKA6_9ACTN|nr:calcium/sodium antiporter [Allocatelliglobosispora scoriae]MBB5868075.1 cation:H+ antiporter [Allocatelliglobosispora scoriae]
MFIGFLLAAAGLVVLTFAADHLVIGSSRLATRMRVNPVVVGVIVIGLGTSAPEFLVSGVAAARGDTGIAIGNLIGSNILNLTLILGIAALIAPIAVASSVVRREVPLAVGAVAVLGVLAWWGLNPLTAAVLTVCLAGALYLLVRWANNGRNAELETEVADVVEAGHRTPVEVLRAVAGLAGVLVGAQLLVTNASSIAEHYGVPQVVVGFTVVALGTSLPELVTTIQAQRRGETDLVVGNLFGSNLFNSLAGGAVVGFAAGPHATARASVALVSAMIFTGMLGWALLRRGLRLTRVEGLVLLVAYAATLPLLLS